MRYELFYWASIQGRGEFVRLALEEAGAAYVDVARDEGGEARMLALLDGAGLACPPFAPPFLKAGNRLIAQTANILLFLGERHGLAPKRDAGKLWAHQLQLTLADFVGEVHDTHHPIAASLYYEDQRREAKRRSTDFLDNRLPKFLGYFERVLAGNSERPRPPCRRPIDLRGPVAIPGRCRPEVRIPERHGARRAEASCGNGAARECRRAAAHRRLSCVAAPAAVQPARPLPSLRGA